MNLLETESFESVFGGKNTRKKPKIDFNTITQTSVASSSSSSNNNNDNDNDDTQGSNNEYGALLANAMKRGDQYDAEPTKDSNIDEVDDGGNDLKKEDLFMKGQSKRIWSELYKVAHL